MKEKYIYITLVIWKVYQLFSFNHRWVELYPNGILSIDYGLGISNLIPAHNLQLKKWKLGVTWPRSLNKLRFSRERESISYSYISGEKMFILRNCLYDCKEWQVQNIQSQPAILSQKVQNSSRISMLQS